MTPFRSVSKKILAAVLLLGASSLAFAQPRYEAHSDIIVSARWSTDPVVRERVYLPEHHERGRQIYCDARPPRPSRHHVWIPARYEPRHHHHMGHKHRGAAVWVPGHWVCR